MKSNIHVYIRALLLVAVAVFCSGTAHGGKIVVEFCAGDYGKNQTVTALSCKNGSEEIGTIEMDGMYASGAVIDGNRHFKFKNGGNMTVTAKPGYVITEVYVYDQTNGTTFSLKPDDSRYEEQNKNYFSAKGSDAFGIYLYSTGFPMNEIVAKSPGGMEFRNLKVTFMRQNPAVVADDVMQLNCFAKGSIKPLNLPSGYGGKIKYSSENTSVAGVSNGVVTAGKSGTAVVNVDMGEWGDYARKRLPVYVMVAKNEINSYFAESHVQWLSSETLLNPLSGIPSGYDGKVEFSVSSSTGTFSIADRSTGRLALAASASGHLSCMLTASLSGSDYYEDKTLEYSATVYVADDEGYVKISQEHEFYEYGLTPFLDDKNIRLCDDITLSADGCGWRRKFCGVFDGGGHTVTLQNTVVDGALFNNVENATLRNIRIAGNLWVRASKYAAPLVALVQGNSRIERCQSDATVYVDCPECDNVGALVAFLIRSGSLTIDDCLLRSKIECCSVSAKCVYGAFVAFSDGNLQLNRSLFMGNVPSAGNLACANGSYDTDNAFAFPQSGMNDESRARLAGGEIAWALQGDREETVWGQTIAGLDGNTHDADAAPLLTADPGKRVNRLQPAVAPDAATLFSNDLEPEARITVSSAGYASYYNSFAYRLPGSIKAYTVAEVTDGQLVLREIAGSTVPAMTAVLLKGNDGKAVSDCITLLPDDMGKPLDGSVNLLRGSDTETMTHSDNGPSSDSPMHDDESSLYYKFSYGPSGTAHASTLGFWWGADGGKSFLSAGHKAWLAIGKQVSPQRGFAISGNGETTGIGNTKYDRGEAGAYTIDGIRLGGNLIYGGVTVVGGKKVIGR